MPLVQSLLASGLEAMTPTDQESVAALRFATAFDDYFQGASVLGIPVTPGTTAPAKAAMLPELIGMSDPNKAAGKMQSAIQQYWQVLGPLASAVWITVGPVIPPAIAPPGLSGIESAVQAAFDANTAGGLSLAASAATVAAAIHLTQLGGMVNLGPPPPGGIPNVPIL
jgi:hypothetical protein